MIALGFLMLISFGAAYWLMGETLRRMDERKRGY